MHERKNIRNFAGKPLAEGDDSRYIDWIRAHSGCFHGSIMEFA